jgi:two-component system CheB/CheR fusion protein
LSNAVKYTKTGKVLLGCRRHGNTLRIEVWDTGMGISEGQREAIFEEFHQIDNPARERSRGLGLGLSIVQRISDLLAHPLNVRSWLGDGSVFSIDIPLVKQGSDVWRQKNLTLNNSTKDFTGLILIVEDDPMVRDALKVLFEAENYQTNTFASAAEAIEQTEENNAWPDVIISDYNLPGRLTGTDVVTKLRKLSSRKIPAIILTGDISNGTLLEIGYADCVHFRKPVKANEMLRHVSNFLAIKAKPPKSPAKIEPQNQEKSPPADAPSTIFLVDDDLNLLTNMKGLLEEHGMAVETYASTATFLETVQADRQGCLVIDAVMPDMGGLALLEYLKSENRHLPAIMVTGYGDVAMAVEAMRVGAVDFLEKPVNADQLLASIQHALACGGGASKSAARDIATERLTRLTPREREVMNHIIQGQPNKVIAFDLGISQRTVENHRAAIMKRTEVKSLPDLVRLVMAAEAS